MERYGRSCRENRMSIAYRGVVECAVAVSRAHEGRFLIMRFSRIRVLVLLHKFSKCTKGTKSV